MEGFKQYNFYCLAIFLITTFEILCVSGFSTKNCDHDQIEKHLKSTLNCVMKSQTKNMKEFLQLNETHIATLKTQKANTSEWCELIDEEIDCFKHNLGRCFNEKITSEFAILMEWYYNKQPYMECNRIEGLSKAEIEAKGKEIVQNYKEDVNELKEIVTFDQECSTEELIVSVKGKYPCFMMHFYSIIQELMPHIVGQKSDLKSIPVCKNVVGLLNTCFDKTNCLSQPEMNLIRDFLATYYNVAMGFVVQLTSKFGSMSNFMETVGVGADDVHDLEGYPKLKRKMKTMMMKSMDLIVADYKVSQTLLNLIAVLISPP